jgi:hypothetical protein
MMVERNGSVNRAILISHKPLGNCFFISDVFAVFIAACPCRLRFPLPDAF